MTNKGPFEDQKKIQDTERHRKKRKAKPKIKANKITLK